MLAGNRNARFSDGLEANHTRSSSHTLILFLLLLPLLLRYLCQRPLQNLMPYFDTISHQTRTFVSSITRTARSWSGQVREQVSGSKTRSWRRSELPSESRAPSAVPAESRPPAANKSNAQKRRPQRRRLRVETVQSTDSVVGVAVAEHIAQMRSAKAVVSEGRYSGLGQDYNGSLPSRTITSLKRWSVGNGRELPGGCPGFCGLLYEVEVLMVFPRRSFANKGYSCVRLRQHL